MLYEVITDRTGCRWISRINAVTGDPSIARSKIVLPAELLQLALPADGEQFVLVVGPRALMARITSYNVCYTKLLRSTTWSCC